MCCMGGVDPSGLSRHSSDDDHITIFRRRFYLFDKYPALEDVVEYLENQEKTQDEDIYLSCHGRNWGGIQVISLTVASS